MKCAPPPKKKREENMNFNQKSIGYLYAFVMNVSLSFNI